MKKIVSDYKISNVKYGYLIEQAAHEVLRIGNTYVAWFLNENECSVAK